MRPWAKWCVEHRMKWVIYAFLLLLTPLYLAYNMGAAALAGMGEIREAWNKVKDA